MQYNNIAIQSNGQNQKLKENKRLQILRDMFIGQVTCSVCVDEQLVVGVANNNSHHEIKLFEPWILSE